MTEICNRLKKEKEKFIKEKQQETSSILHQDLARLQNREMEYTNEVEALRESVPQLEGQLNVVERCLRTREGFTQLNYYIEEWYAEDARFEDERCYRVAVGRKEGRTWTVRPETGR